MIPVRGERENPMRKDIICGVRGCSNPVAMGSVCFNHLLTLGKKAATLLASSEGAIAAAAAASEKIPNFPSHFLAGSGLADSVMFQGAPASADLQSEDKIAPQHIPSLPTTYKIEVDLNITGEGDFSIGSLIVNESGSEKVQTPPEYILPIVDALLWSCWNIDVVLDPEIFQSIEEAIESLSERCVMKAKEEEGGQAE